MRSLGGYRRGEFSVFAVHVRDLLFAPLGRLPCGAVEFARAHEVESQRTQGLQGRVLLLSQTDQQHIVQALVVGDTEELRLRRRRTQRGVSVRQAHRRGQRGPHRGGTLRTLAGERQVQRQPRRQSLQLRLLSEHLRAVAPDMLLQLHDLLCQGNVLRKLCLVQELRRFSLGQRLQQAGFLGRVFVQQLHSVCELRVLGLYPGQLRGVAAAQRRIRLLRKLRRLADLDAA